MSSDVGCKAPAAAGGELSPPQLWVPNVGSTHISCPRNGPSGVNSCKAPVLGDKEVMRAVTSEWHPCAHPKGLTGYEKLLGGCRDLGVSEQVSLMVSS